MRPRRARSNSCEAVVFESNKKKQKEFGTVKSAGAFLVWEKRVTFKSERRYEYYNNGINEPRAGATRGRTCGRRRAASPHRQRCHESAEPVSGEA